MHSHHDDRAGDSDSRLARRTTCALTAFAVGAGLMYMFDPVRGRSRRSVIRDKARGTANHSRFAFRKTAVYSWDQTRGLYAEARSLLHRNNVLDDQLSARVRSAMGRVVSHPSAIQVAARNGIVRLRGPVLAHEVDELLRTVYRIQGVRQIENQLEEHKSAGDVPGLQGGTGGRIRARRAWGMLRDNWSPTTRLLAVATGTLVGTYGAVRRDIAGPILLTAGAGLMLSGLTNLPAKRLTGVGAGRRAVDVRKTINIDAPIDLVFGFFANYANFPHFMSNVREVRDHAASGRSHWTVAGPAGIEIEWDADLTDYVPNKVIAWKSVENASVENAGIIRFDPTNDNGSTRVDIRLSYNPPGGALGHAIATLFGADPKSEMDADLARVKTMLETGHPPRDAAQPLEVAQTH